MENAPTAAKYHKWSKSEIESLIECYESGMSLQEVGDIHKISRERVRQLFESVDYKPRGQTYSKLCKAISERKAVARRAIISKLELERMYLFEKQKIHQIAGHFKVSPEPVK